MSANVGPVPHRKHRVGCLHRKRCLVSIIVILGTLSSGMWGRFDVCAQTIVNNASADMLPPTSNAIPDPISSDVGSELPVLPTVTPFYFVPRDIAPPPGLIIEMSLAPPENIPSSYYELAKYGRIAVDYTHLATINGANIGLAAQALHVEHHLLLYAAGVSSDINNDGMFILTAGLAQYQTGNDQAAFVDAPFVRFRFQSSPDYIFMYSEIETTMHFSQYISGMAGIGLRVSPSLRLMGGFHHTEFVTPAEQTVQMVNGLEGIISWGL
jgi:hypothetical protein